MMKVLGIIAEYNPFHNGHKYQIEQARKLSGADYVVVAMSGNFVQRGLPAITDKFSRTSMALRHGADLVFELPALWATASAEYFAAAGIALLDRLGFVDEVSFGCETEDFRLLSAIADILRDEPEEFSQALAGFLRQGKSFPAARELAICAYLEQCPGQCLERCPEQHPEQRLERCPERCPERHPRQCLEQHPGQCLEQHLEQHPDAVKGHGEIRQRTHGILSSPNNILALEYMKALKKRHSSIRPCPVLRAGADYHDNRLHPAFSSAAAIRDALHSLAGESSPLLREKATEKLLSHNLPPDILASLLDPKTALLSGEDFSEMLYYKLLSERGGGYEEYGDSSEFLSNRISNSLDSYLGFGSFCDLIKTKDTTHARIRRVLLHILLNIRKQDYPAGRALDYIPYFRLLGFRREASFLLKRLEEASPAPLVAKPSQAGRLLPENAKFIYEIDLFASNLYYGVLAQKEMKVERNEFQRELIVL